MFNQPSYCFDNSLWKNPLQSKAFQKIVFQKRLGAKFVRNRCGTHLIQALASRQETHCVSGAGAQAQIRAHHSAVWLPCAPWVRKDLEPYRCDVLVPEDAVG